MLFSLINWMSPSVAPFPKQLAESPLEHDYGFSNASLRSRSERHIPAVLVPQARRRG